MEETTEVIREMKIYYYPLLLVLPLLFLIFKRIKSSSNLPPGPFPWPVIGNILSMGNKPHISLAQLAKAHGPLLSLRLGTKLLVVGSSPDVATEILKTHDRLLSARHVPHAFPASPDRLHLSMLWLDCNDQWKYLRAVCRTELFSAKMIESQSKIRDKKATELVEFLRSREGRIENIARVVFATTFNMLSSIYVSKDFVSLQEESRDEGLKGVVREYLEVVSTPNLADYYSILSRLDLQSLNKKSREMYVKISELWEVIIKQRKETTCSDVSRPRDLLDGLLDREFGNDQVSYLLLELFIAGVDTTTSTVEWAMAELIKSPEAMRNVRNELKKEINVSIVKESDLPRLPYLHYVVKETLRLHPPAPFLLPHRAAETCKVMNYTIPKDSQVFINVWAIGRDPKIWEDPMSFKPERFLESGMELNSNDFRFLPFGSGRRMCPGVPMAAKQVPLILACLINCFHWSLPHDIHPTDLDMDEDFGITLKKEKPLVLIPQVRKL